MSAAGAVECRGCAFLVDVHGRLFFADYAKSGGNASTTELRKLSDDLERKLNAITSLTGQK